MAGVQQRGDVVDRPGVVELRVHGVSGTPPEQMLDAARLVQVRGDDVAGFHRAADEAGTDGRVVEAYAWGGLTSWSRRHALWVFLAPFALVNVAGWMLLPSRDGDDDRFDESPGAALVRLIGLLTSGLFALWLAQVLMDLVANQCGAIDACGRGGPVATVLTPLEGQPGPRIALGAVATALVLGVVVALARLAVRGDVVLDDVGPDAARAGPSTAPAGAGRELGAFADPARWRVMGAPLVWRHVAAMAALLAHVVVATAVQLEGGSVGAVGTAVSVGAAVVGLGALVRTVLESPDGDGKLDRALAVIGLALLAAAVVLLAARDVAELAGAPATGQPLDAFPAPANAIGATVTASLLALVVAQRRDRRSSGAAPVGFAGLGAPAAALLGYGLAALALLSTTAATISALGRDAGIVYPARYDVAAVVTLLALAVGLLVAVPRNALAALRDLRDAPDGAHRPPAVLPAAGASGARRRWVRRVRLLRWGRLLTARADRVLLEVLVVLGLALGATNVSPALARAVEEATWPWTQTMATWVVAVGLPAGVFLLLRSATSSRTTRRLVGILWDVVTFWPRSFHPLAPPSYASRAVPELHTRLEVLGEGPTHVVVSAHSQGSLVALAALDGLRDDLPVALVTHGSPVGRLYARYFPAHVPPAVDRVAARLRVADERPRWLNLYRSTDPIGGAIRGEAGRADPRPASAGAPDGLAPVDLLNPLPDPAITGDTAGHRPERGQPFPSPAGHAAYWSDPAHAKVVDALRDALAASTRTSPPDDPVVTVHLEDHLADHPEPTT